MDKEIKIVTKKTGLTEGQAEIYRCFYHHADWSGESGIILDGDVKFELGRLLGKGEMTSAELQLLVRDSYNHWLNVFKKKGLIAEGEVKSLYSSYSYPVLIGYQPFNDVELYMAYRKKGEKRWNGRISADLLSTEKEKMLAQNYEFRNDL